MKIRAAILDRMGAEAPYAVSKLRRSSLIVSGMVRTSL